MKYAKLLLMGAFIAGMLYSCVSCETGGPIPQRQVSHRIQ